MRDCGHGAACSLRATTTKPKASSLACGPQPGDIFREARKHGVFALGPQGGARGRSRKMSPGRGPPSGYGQFAAVASRHSETRVRVQATRNAAAYPELTIAFCKASDSFRLEATMRPPLR